MFVKIKLEKPDISKKPLMFTIDDSATVFDLKTSLESFVNIAIDQQEIWSLDCLLENDVELTKVVNQETGDKINGAAISLYTNEKFFCFLQFYNKNESENQSNYFSQPYDARKLPIDQLPQYIEQLDSDESFQSSSSDSDSTDQSSDSSHNTRSSKRRTIVRVNASPKRYRESMEDFEKINEPTSTTIRSMQEVSVAITPTAVLLASSTIPADGELNTTFAVESAKQSASPIANAVVETSALESTQIVKEKPAAPYVAPTTTSIEKPAAAHISPTTTAAKLRSSSKETPVAPYVAPTTNVVKSSLTLIEKPTAPYIAMKPEQRRYALVINKDIDEQHPDYDRLLLHFYELFESSQGCGRLNFSESPIMEYDAQLWVLCEDLATCEWIVEGARILNSYKCCSFIKYFGLSKCCVVLPQVVERKELADIFHLLELQNSGLRTSKWCVVERKKLDQSSEDYNSQAITSLCTNEIITLYVDKESKALIQEKGSKLKYCFWKLAFQF